VENRGRDTYSHKKTRTYTGLAIFFTLLVITGIPLFLFRGCKQRYRDIFKKSRKILLKMMKIISKNKQKHQ
mgnify:CR=1